MTAWPRRTLGILAATGTFACLLGYWQWLFLQVLRGFAHSGVMHAGASPDRLVREFLVFGLDARLMAPHVGIVGGLLVLVLMAAHREFALAAPRTVAVVFVFILSLLVVLWHPLIRHVVVPTPRFGPNPHLGFMLLSACWLGASLALTGLCCLRPSRVIPWFLVLVSLGSLLACVALAFRFSGQEIPPYHLSRFPVALRTLGFSMLPVALGVAAGRVTRSSIGTQGAVWLLVIAAACCYETWRAVLVSQFCYGVAWPPADAGTRFNLPFHGGFIVIEAVLAYLVWSRRRGLLEPQELRGGFPVVQEKKESTSA